MPDHGLENTPDKLDQCKVHINMTSLDIAPDRHRCNFLERALMRSCATLALLAMLAAQLASPAHAVLTIEITKGKQGATPIAIVPFGFSGSSKAPREDLAAIVNADLARSGRFSPIATADLPSRPFELAQVDTADWRLLGTSHIVIGRMRVITSGQYAVEFWLVDVFGGKHVAFGPLNTSAANLRRTAHQISDAVYERLTGERGAFDTRIAYITETGRGDSRKYQLNVANSDGQGARTVVNSASPMMSPSWSPDGRQLTYVSFEAKRAEIYLQDVASGKRQRLTHFPGLNGAPAFSPDGRSMAMTLSKDGNPEIYIQDLRSNRLRRLTVNGAIDTEPSWSPDGRWIAFTSDRGGRPQIYRVSIDGSSRAERVTFEGAYNARPRYSPDGSKLAMVHGNDGVFRIAVMDLENGAVSVVTDSYLDESPSFAPNGSMILYATSTRHGSSLAAVSADGDVQQTLIERRGSAREPAWSPYRNP
ncbi:MAG: TolB protein [Gammaproteobacteria bacterium]|jgi:TolB protein